MMTTRNRWGATLFWLPAVLLLAACGTDRSNDRSALRDDELRRELDLALRGDTALATFEDAPIVPEPELPAPTPLPQTTAPPRSAPPPARQPSPAPAPAPAPAPRWVTATAPIGTMFAVTLNQTLSTETSRPGEAFTATLQEAIRDGMGNVVVPAGATVRGRVTQVETSGRVGETAVIKLAFESIAFGGSSHRLAGTVVEANPQRSHRRSTGEQAARIGAGAAAGAVLGRVIGGDTRSTVRGAAIGAAAGTAIAMGTADVDAVLPAGSRMVIRLDAPIDVRRPVD
jgi:hypothetical protein